MSEDKEQNYFKKRLEEDPDNYVLQILARMTEDEEKPFVPWKLPEIEDEDPVKLGRHGDCGCALEVLLEFYPSGIPHRLTSGDDFAHTFLLHKGQPMDMGGYTTIEDMRLLYNAPSHRSEPVTVTEVRRAFPGWRNEDEKRRLVQHFRKFILANVGSRFPEPEVPLKE